MKRRAFLLRTVQCFTAAFFGQLSAGCTTAGKLMTPIDELSSALGPLLANLLHGHDVDDTAVSVMRKCVRDGAAQSIYGRMRLEWAYRMSGAARAAESGQLTQTAGPNPFIEKTLHNLTGYSAVIDVLERYLDEDRALMLLDYPDVPGVYGECGWCVTVGSVWDRYT